ncbi:F-box domain-containing protein [Mycena sanguinolenta]|uniref:F-box domain-containing protein n=1 Tax=Mycena sanguinolenta TaxID=230812 RepID=A0A8H6X4X3_9AGAR|nr:F-box domain-containing protein [Mycena sanguinolenta]
MASPSALRARLTEINEEMDALKARLRLLAIERRKVIGDLDCIVYPVLTLPPEITSEIFSHYVLDPHLGRPRTSTPSRGPFALAGVCQSWRDICFSTPCLWASLRIHPDQAWVADDFFHLKCCLQRAENHPLDLHVSACEPRSTLPMQIYSILSHYVPQIRAFTFSLDTPFSFPNEEIGGRVPLLTKLTVNITAKNNTPVMVTAFRDAPRLREVCLSGASLRWISLPWIQLTHLEYSDETVPSCLQVLEETPNLEVLDVSLARSHSDWVVVTARYLTLPRLHTLRFSYDP